MSGVWAAPIVQSDIVVRPPRSMRIFGFVWSLPFAAIGIVMFVGSIVRREPFGFLFACAWCGILVFNIGSRLDPILEDLQRWLIAR